MVKINGFRLDAPIEHAPKIYIGAQGAMMLRLAGELGDGVIVNFITPETLPAMLDHTREGMRSVGKDPATLDVVCRIILAVDEDEAVTRNLFRRSLTAYVTVPQYNKFFREIGYDKEAGIARRRSNRFPTTWSKRSLCSAAQRNAGAGSTSTRAPVSRRPPCSSPRSRKLRKNAGPGYCARSSGSQQPSRGDPCTQWQDRLRCRLRSRSMIA